MINFAWAALYVLISNLLVVAVFRIGAGAWDGAACWSYRSPRSSMR